jgi:GR25 family glycosyltransferase involved in LPS biosynthesis
MELIHHVVFINLDHRTDRLENMKQVLSKFPSEKITRLSAVSDKKYPWIGCYQSHINAFKLAIKSGWENILILEDDACWNDSIEWDTLKTKLKANYDVLVLGGMRADYDTSTLKLNACFGTSSYIVSKHYYSTILSNFEEGKRKCIQDDSRALGFLKVREKFRLDNYWHNLMRRDNWFLVKMMTVIPSYSDITNNHVDYRNRF